MTPPETITLANGRTVTHGTAWWVERLRGSRAVLAGGWLACVHNVALADRCRDCEAAR